MFILCRFKLFIYLFQPASSVSCCLNIYFNLFISKSDSIDDDDIVVVYRLDDVVMRAVVAYNCPHNWWLTISNRRNLVFWYKYHIYYACHSHRRNWWYQISSMVGVADERLCMRCFIFIYFRKLNEINNDIISILLVNRILYLYLNTKVANKQINVRALTTVRL